MKITYHGHSAFTVEAAGQKLLIDPFLTGNPKFGGDVGAVSQGATAVLLTHGHNDHFGDTLDILSAQSAAFAGIVEACDYVTTRLADADCRPINMGGTVGFGGVTATLVKAAHSSSYTDEQGVVHYMGEPGGFILRAAGEPTVYFMGDTDAIADFGVFAERFAPDVVVPPIGGNFTMDGEAAAWALNKYFPDCTAIPCHYATFPILAPDDSAFAAALSPTVTNRRMESGTSIDL